ncbi:hypothetical protein OIU76_019483 [Salix suchowensis]|nr:hypothetical protein OIU76_019483 [Salix suchowensis]KAJ6298338.1 hypothetical protein OIU76_019483 [Salix suchowensis]
MGISKYWGFHMLKMLWCTQKSWYTYLEGASFDLEEKIRSLIIFSIVLSVTLDEWSDDEIDAMIEVGGNLSANSIYEAFLPDGVSKPGPDSSNEERIRFIRSKYELQEFLKPSLRITSGKASSSSLKSNLSTNIVDSFRIPSVPQNMDGMVEFMGLLKVKIKQGTNLAIRDMMSSDPYVIVSLGKQTAQTTVMKSNLNPVWNEELMLSVPQDFGPIKLVSLFIIFTMLHSNFLFIQLWIQSYKSKAL